MGCDSEEFVYLARVQRERYAETDNIVCVIIILFEITESLFAFECFLAEILSVDPKTAEDDACKMEHSVSSVTQERLAKFIEFVLSRPKVHPEWLKMFDRYVSCGEIPAECTERCLKEE